MTRAVRPRTLRRIASRERQRGYLGLNSYRRLAASALSGPAFAASLLTSIVPDKAAAGTVPTFTRATPKSFTDWEGVVRTAISGEACFTGARRVQNYLNSTEAMSGANWTSINGGAGSVATCTSGFTAPDGTSTAFRVQANRGATNLAADISTLVNTAASAPIGLSINSIWIKSNTGANQNVLLSLAAANFSDVIVATPTWQRVANAPKTYAIVTANSFAIGTRGTLGSDQVIDVLVWRPQAELITGQSSQNPSEYVSVGVLAAPYQGAGVDGVQYFATQNGNTVTSNVVTEATGAPIGLTKNQSAYVSGVSGTYFSSPDSVASSITSDIDLRVDVAMANWTSGSTQSVFAKWADAALQGEYLVRLSGTGVIVLNWYDGTSSRQVSSTVAVNPGAAVRTALRVTLQCDNGAGGHTVTFYTAPTINGPWTQLGATANAGAFTTSLQNSTAPVEVGPYNAGATTPGVMTIYRAQVYAGINGTLAVDFNPQDYTSGATWASSTTGETWTKNGNAAILNNPLKGYDDWQAATNLCLQSADFTTTWVPTAMTVGGSVTLPDGTTGIKNKLQEDNTSAQHFVQQSVTKAASVLTYTYTCYLKQAERTFGLLQAFDAAGGGGNAYFNLATGAVGTTGTFGASPFTSISGSITQAGNGFWRCVLMFTSTTNTTLNLRVCTASADNSSSYLGTTGSGIYAWGAQLEQTAFVTPYIPTTTVAVTRNADVLTDPTAGNISDAAGTVYAEYQAAFIVAGGRVLGDGNTSSAPTPLQLDTANSGASAFDGTTQASGPPGSPTAGVLIKAATVWPSSPNKFKVVVGGTLGTEAAYDGAFNLSSIGIGVGGSKSLNGNIRNVKIWTRALPDAQLQAMTT